MSRHYLGVGGPHGELNWHFSAVMGPFETKEEAQQAAANFDSDFPGYAPWVQPWPEHFCEIAKSVPDQLADARAELAAIQADIAFLKEFSA